MFSKKHGKWRGHDKSKKDSNSKKHHIRNWMHSKKDKKREANLFGWVLSDILDLKFHLLKWFVSSYKFSRVSTRQFHQLERLKNLVANVKVLYNVKKTAKFIWRHPSSDRSINVNHTKR